MGEVYGAYDPKLDRKVALKVIRTHSDDDGLTSQRRDRLMREARAMAKLSHGHVVTIYDVGIIGDEVFIAMEYVAGQTLAVWAAAEPRSWTEVIEVYTQAGRGLAAAHRAGLVHRDFKPENALIGDDGTVKVTDFGVARGLDFALWPASSDPPLDDVPVGDGQRDTVPRVSPEELASLACEDTVGAEVTRPGVLVGTPRYMAPEQFAGDTIDERTDQFSFCVALYEALYGQLPFAGDTVAERSAEVCEGRLREPPPDARVPGWVQAALVRGLEVQRSDRYPSMHELLDALSPRRRARRRLTILAALTVALVASLLIWGRFAHESSELCSGAEDKLVGVWDGERRGALMAVFATSSEPHSQTIAANGSEVLDDYTARWTALHTEACRSVRVRREFSENVLDLRMTCLRRRLDQVKVVTDLLLEGDDDVVERAVALTADLGDLRRCADIEALQAELPPPENARLRATVEEVRRGIVTATALYSAARQSEAAELVESLFTTAEETGYEVIIAEVYSTRGGMRLSAGNFAEAESDLGEAYFLALKHRHDELAAHMALSLVRNASMLYPDQQHARDWLRHARAVVERLGPDNRFHAALELTLGRLAHRRRDFAVAAEHYERALALHAKRFEDDDLWMAEVSQGLGLVLLNLGRLEEAAEVFERAGTIFSSRHFPDHPFALYMLANLVETRSLQGREGEAARLLDHHIELWRMRADSPSGLTWYRILRERGRAALTQKRIALAALFLERALTVAEATDPRDPAAEAAIIDEMAAIAIHERRFQRAADLIERARQLRERAPTTGNSDKAASLRMLGNLARARGRYREAHTHFELALSLLDPADAVAMITRARILGDRGRTYEEQKKYRLALTTYKRLVDLYGQRGGRVIALAGVGRAHFRLGALEPAIAALESALAVLNSYGLPDQHAPVRYALAGALWARGRDRARAHALIRELIAERSARGMPVADLVKWLESHPLPAASQGSGE